ncbi:MAG: glucose-6-phosphate dehydrogenase [Acidimicrobiia bacterium]|nr:glucose-6-phosphate dehydrogenase [Acidimicrobiia bacterium]
MTEPHLFVIYGGTGDLTGRKLLPSMYQIMVDSGIAEQSVLLGIGSRELDDIGYRDYARKSLSEAGIDDVDPWCDERVYYQRVPRGEQSLGALADKIAAIETAHHLPGNRVFYLALPPTAVPTVITGLSKAGLSQSPGWTRVVVEKPFGHDLASAQELNRLIHRHFDESQIYRIDHYLGKETVRNLLAFRFANMLFESSWDRDRVDAIEITVAESLGIGSRSTYYDGAGVIRDMMQNHLTQLLALVAMEAPHSFEPEAIRDAKVQLLNAVRHIDLEELTLGQYGSGHINGGSVPGYRNEPDVPADSITPTYVSLRVDIDNWRWQGVPFYLRTGKRMPDKSSQIVVRFRPPPICLFHGKRDQCEEHQNTIKLILQPNEGFEVNFDVKSPGETLHLVEKKLRFMYADEFDRLPDAYQTLLFDIIQGDQTLFVRSDEVEASWRLYDPVIAAADNGHPLDIYPAGTWGPPGRHTPIQAAGRPIRGEVRTSPQASATPPQTPRDEGR